MNNDTLNLADASEDTDYDKTAPNFISFCKVLRQEQTHLNENYTFLDQKLKI